MAYAIERRIIAAIPKMTLASNSYIIAHESGNGNNTGDYSLDNEVGYMSRNWQTAFTAFWVGGGGRIVQIAEDGYTQWGAGAYANPHAPAQVELARCDTKAEFLKDYGAYVWLLAYLADKFGLPRTLDTGRTGIKTHAWVTEELGGTTHTDPYGYLTSWGITPEQFARDLAGSTTGDATTAGSTTPTSTALYRVQVGAFSDVTLAYALAGRLKSIGYEAVIVKKEAYYKVQVGAYRVKANANAVADSLKKVGFESYIVYQTATGSDVSKKQYVSLPASVTSWRVYPLYLAPMAGNESGYLNPSLYGGLQYAVVYFAQTNVAVIQTQMFGKVQIYVGPETGATIYWE